MADDMPEPQLPSQLVEDLSSICRSPVAVPARVDDAVLNRGRAALAGRTRWRPLRLVGAAAAAACILLAARTLLHVEPIPDDIDGNQRVDIVDALKLARQIESGQGQDINGDGVIDQRDVDSLAMVVVSLGGGVQ